MGTGARPEMGYPAQLNPPPEPQLPAELEVPEAAVPREANVDIFLWVSGLWQAGQAGERSASEKRTIFSKA